MKKRLLLLTLSCFVGLSLFGCAKVNNSDITIVGRIVNIEDTAVISRRITIQDDDGNIHYIEDTWGEIKNKAYGTKLEVVLNENNSPKEITYLNKIN